MMFQDAEPPQRLRGKNQRLLSSSTGTAGVCTAVDYSQRTGGSGGKPVMLPKLNPMSLDSSAGSSLDAQEKVHIALLQMEREDQVREFELRRELKLRKLEADTAERMRELELKAKARPVSVGESLSSTSRSDVGKNIPLVKGERLLGRKVCCLTTGVQHVK